MTRYDLVEMGCSSEYLKTVVNKIRKAVSAGDATNLLDSYNILGETPSENDLKEALQNAIYKLGCDIDSDTDVGILYRKLYGRDYATTYGQKIGEYKVLGKEKRDFVLSYNFLLPEERTQHFIAVLIMKGYKVLQDEDTKSVLVLN